MTRDEALAVIAEVGPALEVVAHPIPLRANKADRRWAVELRLPAPAEGYRVIVRLGTTGRYQVRHYLDAARQGIRGPAAGFVTLDEVVAFLRSPEA